jgi:general secretion pathway protein G
MESASISHLGQRREGKSASRAEGFSLLEMMMVVTVILIVASISTPIYMTAMVRAREAVLRDDLFTLRSLIDRFTLDNRRAPARLEELVEGGYVGRIPTDPFTGSNETWQEEKEDAPLSPKQTSPGIVDAGGAYIGFYVCA